MTSCMSGRLRIHFSKWSDFYRSRAEEVVEGGEERGRRRLGRDAVEEFT